MAPQDAAQGSRFRSAHVRSDGSDRERVNVGATVASEDMENGRAARGSGGAENNQNKNRRRRRTDAEAKKDSNDRGNDEVGAERIQQADSEAFKKPADTGAEATRSKSAQPAPSHESSTQPAQETETPHASREAEGQERERRIAQAGSKEGSRPRAAQAESKDRGTRTASSRRRRESVKPTERDEDGDEGDEEGAEAECRGLQRRYGVQPCVSWGEAARRSDVQERWSDLDCDAQLGVRCQVAGADDAAPDKQPGAQDYEAGRRSLMAARGWDGVGGSGSESRSAEEAFAAARLHLERASGAGHGGAAYLLGEMAEFGDSAAGEGDADEAAAARLYAAALARKSGEAGYALADRLAASLSEGWLCPATNGSGGGVGGGGGGGGGEDDGDPAGSAGVREAVMAAAMRGSELGLLALSAKDYEAALAAAEGPEAEARCEPAIPQMLPGVGRARRSGPGSLASLAQAVSGRAG